MDPATEHIVRLVSRLTDEQKLELAGALDNVVTNDDVDQRTAVIKVWGAVSALQ
jgi:hypothetical protein